MAAAGETEHGEGARGFSPALGAGWPRPTSFLFGINFSPLASVSGSVPVAPSSTGLVLLPTSVLINTKQKGKAANSWIHLPCLLISWPAPIAAASGHLT